MSDMYLVIGLIIAILTTAFMRTIPFRIFKDREIPGIIRYLGHVLPPAIMVILVIYGLKDMDISTFPYGLSEFLALGLVLLVHLYKRSTIISIVVGTLAYMVLIRVL